MTLSLPGVTLSLARDVPGVFPAELRSIDNADLRELLARVDPTPETTRGSGARDWSDLNERIHYIADLFRVYQRNAELHTAPFRAEQAALIKAGARPAGPLDNGPSTARTAPNALPQRRSATGAGVGQPGVDLVRPAGPEGIAGAHAGGQSAYDPGRSSGSAAPREIRAASRGNPTARPSSPRASVAASRRGGSAQAARYAAASSPWRRLTPRCSRSSRPSHLTAARS